MHMAYDFSKLKGGIKEKEEWLKKELSQIRTGRANPSVLDSVEVEAYGSRMPIEGVASVTIEDARSLRLSPWDPANIKPLEKAISTASLGVSVSVDERGIRVSFPELTSERRAIIVKAAKDKLEHTRIGLRQLRDEVIKDIDVKEKAGGMGEDEKFRLKAEVQKTMDAATKALDEHFAKKEKEILQ